MVLRCISESPTIDQFGLSDLEFNALLSLCNGSIDDENLDHPVVEKPVVDLFRLVIRRLGFERISAMSKKVQLLTVAKGVGSYFVTVGCGRCRDVPVQRSECRSLTLQACRQ